jgi:hypothetical protein
MGDNAVKIGVQLSVMIMAKVEAALGERRQSDGRLLADLPYLLRC